MTARKSARRPGLTLHTWQHYTNAPMFVLSAFFLFAYSWQILAGTHTRLCNLVINLVWVLYSIDYAISLYLAPNRWSWFKSNLILLITMILPMFQPLRLLRFVPMLHMFNRSAGTASRGRISLYAVAVVAMLIYVGALAEYSVEHKAPGATITSFPLSIWWAFVTVTTVGYGDVYPVTLTGRCIAVALMLTGIALIGIVSAMISSWIIDQVNGGARNITKDSAAVTGTHAQSDNEYNSADIRLMRAEILRLTDTVGQLNNELQRTHRLTKRAHRRADGHHGFLFLDDDGHLHTQNTADGGANTAAHDVHAHTAGTEDSKRPAHRKPHDGPSIDAHDSSRDGGGPAHEGPASFID